MQVSPDAVKRLIKAKTIEAGQIVAGTPWLIRRSELVKKSVIEAVQSIKKTEKPNSI